MKSTASITTTSTAFAESKVVSGFSRRDSTSMGSVAVHEGRLFAKRALHLSNTVLRLKPLTTLRELADITFGRSDNAGNFPNTRSADSDIGCEFSNTGREVTDNAENFANIGCELADTAKMLPNNVGGLANNAFSRANTGRKFANTASKLANTGRKFANIGLIFSNTGLFSPITV